MSQQPSNSTQDDLVTGYYGRLAASERDQLSGDIDHLIALVTALRGALNGPDIRLMALADQMPPILTTLTLLTRRAATLAVRAEVLDVLAPTDSAPPQQR